MFYCFPYCFIVNISVTKFRILLAATPLDSQELLEGHLEGGRGIFLTALSLVVVEVLCSFIVKGENHIGPVVSAILRY